MRKVVALCAIGVVGCAAACSRPQAQSVSPAVPTVAVAKVTRGDVAQVLTVAAEFRPYQEIDVHAKVAGFLKSISVDVGDRVEAGQLLAVLEIPELQDELQQDEAAVKRAQRGNQSRAAPISDARSRSHDVAHLGASALTNVDARRGRIWSRSRTSTKRPGAIASPKRRSRRPRPRWPSAREQLEIAEGQPAPRRRRCSPTRGSPRRSPASSRTATPTPAR